MRKLIQQRIEQADHRVVAQLFEVSLTGDPVLGQVDIVTLVDARSGQQIVSTTI